MPIDREATLKRAEKLLRQGKLDGAIEEYVRLIEDQPRDWNAINALGDLYVRAGDADRAAAQFTRVADHLFGEGFLQRAAALYKKALKVQGQHEHSLFQLAEIAARQRVLVDAKAYLRQLEELRRQRGDEGGVAECRARLRALEETAEQPAPPPGPRPGPAAVAASPELLEDDPAQLFAFARRELAGGSEPLARAMLTRVLMLDPGRHGEVLELALGLARDGRTDSAFACGDLVADAALLAGDWQHAVEALQAFVGVVRHVPALLKLLEVCVDAGLDAPMRAAQAQLVDAYLDGGCGAEARVIAEDLLEAEPDHQGHAERLRRALELLGFPAAPESPGDDAAAEATAAPVVSDAIEIDLTEALADVGAPSPPAVAAGADPYERAVELLQAGRVADAMAALEAAARVPRTRAKAAAELGRLYVQRGDLQRGIEWLERAADGPAASPDEGFAVLYELAGALERLGEPARALAIFIDLDAEAADYRDVRERIEQLARAQAGSRRR
ncbi:MAG: tetratricopeptide repeat protein [Acidobacteria bacterium]|nr:tetratricopeptide repeat protein [Acidobacteriota bacterium]